MNCLVQSCPRHTAKPEVKAPPLSPAPLDSSTTARGQGLRRRVLVSGAPIARTLFQRAEMRLSFLASVYRASTLNYDNVGHGTVLPASPRQSHCFQARLQRVHSAVLSRVWSNRLQSLCLRQEVWRPGEPFVTAATRGLLR